MNLMIYKQILEELKPYHAQLIAVSKNQSMEDLLQLYQAGQRIFAENRVQNLVERKSLLPSDIEWHLIGHLQKNKVKKIISWVHMIQSIDTFELAAYVNQEAQVCGRILPVLLEVKISSEATKYGFEPESLLKSLTKDPWTDLQNIRIDGLMGMASLSSNSEQIQIEFKQLYNLFIKIKTTIPQLAFMSEVSMGMSGDYPLALKEGSTMVRIGSKLFS